MWENLQLEKMKVFRLETRGRCSGRVGERREIKGYSFGSGFERKDADLGIVLGLWELAAGTKRLGGKRRGLWVTG